MRIWIRDSILGVDVAISDRSDVVGIAVEDLDRAIAELEAIRDQLRAAS